jgi:hypothetical protein
MAELDDDGLLGQRQARKRERQRCAHGNKHPGGYFHCFVS